MNRLAHRLLLILLLGMCCVVALPAWWSGEQLRRQHIERARRQLKSDCRHVAQATDLLLARLSAQARLLARQDHWHAMQATSVQSRLQDTIAGQPQLGSLALLRPSGHSIASAGRWVAEDLPMLLEPLRAEFLLARDGAAGSVYLGGPVYWNSTVPVLVFFAPIVPPDAQQPVGVLAQLCALDQVAALLRQHVPGHGGRLAILDSQGQVVLTPQRAQGHRDDLRLEFNDVSLTDAAHRPQAEWVHQHAADTNSGVPVAALAAVADMAQVGDGRKQNWRMVLVRSSDAVAPGRWQHAVQLATVAAIPAIGVLCLVGWWTTRSLRQLNTATEWASAVANGDSERTPPRIGWSEGREMLQAVEAMRAKLLSAGQDAQAAGREHTEFLAHISHELRTPMAAILGHAELLGSPDLAAQQSQDCVQTIQRNGQYLLALIDETLDAARLEAGKIQLEQQPLKLLPLIQDVLDLLRPRAAEKQLYLRPDYSDTMPEFIWGDDVRLRQILINLVGNAVKFTQRGGVTLSARWLDDPLHPCVRISVNDTGVGMSPFELEKIFESFQQANASVTRRFGGSGLGLRISRDLASLMGTGLKVSSQVGVGSTFRFDIDICPSHDTVIVPSATLVTTTAVTDDAPEPDAESQASPNEEWKTAEQTMTATPQPPDASADNTEPVFSPSASPAANEQPAMRVLLAEDGEDNRRLFEYVLTQAGMLLTCVETGIDAVEQVSSAQYYGRPFDIILMDMQMPVLDGLEATRRLRNAGVNTPIIALTARSDQQQRERCMEVGCDDYLTKPISSTDLVAACHNWHQRMQAAAALIV